MDYSNINANYKYDMLAEAIHSRQVEHFHYDFDKSNYEHMLANMEEGPSKDHMQKNYDDTLAQMAIVDSIYNALVAQIDDQAAYDAAVARRTTT